MVNFSLLFGLGRRIDGEADASTTVATLLGNANYKAVLGYGESVVALVNGSTVANEMTLGELGPNPQITLETRSNSKAA